MFRQEHMVGRQEYSVWGLFRQEQLAGRRELPPSGKQSRVSLPAVVGVVQQQHNEAAWHIQ